MSWGWLVKSIFLVSCWAITGFKVFFSPGGWGIWILLGRGEEIWTRTIKSFQQNRHVLFFNMEVFKGMRFSKVPMLKELSEGWEGCWNFNWLKHYRGLWKDGLVSRVCKELKFIQSIMCMKWLPISKFFWIFWQKLLDRELFLGFQKIICRSNISIRIFNWFLDLKNSSDYNLNLFWISKIHWDYLLLASTEVPMEELMSQFRGVKVEPNILQRLEKKKDLSLNVEGIPRFAIFR